jgi:hypothetical protein
MNQRKVRLLQKVESGSQQAVQTLSRQLARSPADEKEAIAAGIEFEQWLADACKDCQNGG